MKYMFLVLLSVTFIGLVAGGQKNDDQFVEHTIEQSVQQRITASAVRHEVRISVEQQEGDEYQCNEEGFLSNTAARMFATVSPKERVTACTLICAACALAGLNVMVQVGY